VTGPDVGGVPASPRAPSRETELDIVAAIRDIESIGKQPKPRACRKCPARSSYARRRQPPKAVLGGPFPTGADVWRSVGVVNWL
jgi:hypothetical protein